LDSGSTADAMTPLLTLDSVRTKPSMIVSLLQRYAEGLTAAQIHQLLAPAVARSAVFQILKRLETQRLVSKSGQTFRLVAGQDQQHPAISGVL
jgi:Fe2+ or Zn2+ uptake regulation protein